MSHKKPERKSPATRPLALLTAQAETVNQIMIGFYIAAFQIIEQTSALRDHLEQATPRMIIFLVRSEMFGQIVDTTGQKRDLNLRRSGIARVRFE
jgi:hypothetical protein